MNRRSFLKLIGVTATAVVVAPKVLVGRSDIIVPSGYDVHIQGFLRCDEIILDPKGIRLLGVENPECIEIRRGTNGGRNISW